MELVAQDVSVKQGKFSVNRVSFKLKDGDILGLVGRSGSGKSTIIKAIIGINKISSGKIELIDSDKKIDINKYLGYSPQDNALFPLLTLNENIKIFGKLNNLNNDSIKRGTTELLDKLDLTNSINKRIGQLSGGMQKRADLACSLIHDPKIIILDEPFNGLDVSLQKFIWQFIKILSAKGKIIIISSHMLEDMQKNCTQFGLIEKGNYYDTDQIFNHMKLNKEKNLESFLQKLFYHDLILEKK